MRMRTTDETQIRQLIDDWRSALCARDLDRLMQHYAPAVLFFDAVPPYQHRGAGAYRRTSEAMFPYSRPASAPNSARLSLASAATSP